MAVATSAKKATSSKSRGSHTPKAKSGKKVSSVTRSSAGMQVNYKDGTGNWREAPKKK